jgi:hypothetical protein
MDMLKKKKHRNNEKEQIPKEIKVTKLEDYSDDEGESKGKNKYTLSIVIPSSVVDNAQVNISLK